MPLTPLSPKGARGGLTLLPSPPWGRGWLVEPSSSAEARRVRGFYPLSTLRRDTTLGTRCWGKSPDPSTQDQVPNPQSPSPKTQRVRSFFHDVHENTRTWAKFEGFP